MATTPTIELAYNYLQSNKGDASFEDIWNNISKDIPASKKSKNEIIAELYSDLVLDNRFALTSEGKWGLRDYLKFDDIKKQYDYVDKFETTEEFDDLDYMSSESSLFDDGDTTSKLETAKLKLNADDYDDEDDIDELDEEEDEESDEITLVDLEDDYDN
ncbi:DNA-directed RNA polymerase subunit delta [Spiroplasma tabanidicola]|uniref:RNAP delta factor n=1 Tax=Spiroplasma tabanidicola TaxID=324079 RepID=A0A6I6CEM9_9MOLU|nr:DNA-directed RNA polymerase subunit delta [Spiroplasma tabanidicola]QGS52434.1 DNA directed RNA polymerase subunit delta [Spiroplasma tabanidicola]